MGPSYVFVDAEIILPVGPVRYHYGVYSVPVDWSPSQDCSMLEKQIKAGNHNVGVMIRRTRNLSVETDSRNPIEVGQRRRIQTTLWLILIFQVLVKKWRCKPRVVVDSVDDDLERLLLSDPQRHHNIRVTYFSSDDSWNCMITATPTVVDGEVRYKVKGSLIFNPSPPGEKGQIVTIGELDPVKWIDHLGLRPLLEPGGTN